MIVKKLQAITLGITLVLFGSVLNGHAADYAHELKDKDITFAWSVDGDKLAVKLSAKTEGWVGIGFNPSQEMKDAGFILGYVKKGEVKIVDHFGVDENRHEPDEKLGGTSDVTVVGGSEEGGVTTIEFTIPLQPADKHDASIDPQGESVVLLAYGAGRDSFRAKHKYRSAFKVNLSTGDSQEAE
ncbi:MAG: DOMON domain-containing protein [Desulforhopalus sp.]